MSLWTIYTCEYAHDKKNIPYKLRDKWRTTACNIQETKLCFFDIVDFLEHYLELAQGLKEVALQLTYLFTYLLRWKERAKQ